MKYVICALLLLLLSCEQEQKVSNYSPETSPVYTLCKTATLPKDVSLQAQLDTLRGGKLLLKVMVRNQSSSNLLLNPLQASLLTEDERRQLPVSVRPQTENLAAGEEREYQWLFAPVNDLYLYQRSGLHGDLKKIYRLPLSFIKGMEETLSFCFPEEAYIQYSKQMAAKAPVLYAPSPKTLHPETAARQEQYWAQTNGALQDGQAASAYFSEQEFFSAGVNLRHALYHRGDSLYLRLHLINHAPYVLMVDPAAVTVTAFGQVHPVKEAQARKERKAALYAVRKGDRLSLNLRYPLPAADSVAISLQGIQVGELQKPLFPETFTWVRQ